MVLTFTNLGPLELSIIIGIVLLVLLISLLLFKKLKKPAPKKLDIAIILNAFGDNNIEEISFKRNKINVKIKDMKHTNMQLLKAEGAVGINIVGDTIKFYVEEKNEEIYQALKEALERKT
ncbi:hypothetical protein [Liberiplasma polymorphum]|uniref:hypothetical protein n=1 Tax=Liberiplasma polymorphum TaxID=3374570 RepID=UPI003774BD26